MVRAAVMTVEGARRIHGSCPGSADAQDIRDSGTGDSEVNRSLALRVITLPVTAGT